jgi:hypothetical protein
VVAQNTKIKIDRAGSLNTGSQVEVTGRTASDGLFQATQITGKD